MNDFESLISALLSYADDDHFQQAQRLSRIFEDFSQIAQQDYSYLSKLTSENSAILLRVLAALAKRRVTDSFKFNKEHTEDELIEYLKALYFDAPNETVYILSLDAKDRIVSCDFVVEGTVNATEILPRKLIEILMKRDCKKAILVHNHPLGGSDPSDEDRRSTNSIRGILKNANCEIVNHYVVAGDSVSCIYARS